MPPSTSKPRAKPSLLAAIASLLGLAGCAISTPFDGPGYRKATGFTRPDNDQPVVLALTHAVLDAQSREQFDLYTQKVASTMRDQPGMLGFSIRKQLLGNEVWTLSVWSDDDAIDQFVRSSMHKQAIAKGMPAVLSARFARFDRDPALPAPTWSEALELLQNVPMITYDRELRAAPSE